MAPTTLTETEIKTLVAAFESAEAPLQINYEVMAQKCNYKTSKVARDMWGRIKKKLESTPSQVGKDSTKGGSPKKRARGKNLLFTDDEEAGPPAKRPRTSEDKKVKTEED